MSKSSSPFPMPSSIGAVPGAENWQSMYPYYMHVQAEDDKRFWFYNSMHFSEPMSAFDMITAEAAYHAMGAVMTRVFAFPTAMGIDYRLINGRVYISANTVTDPAKIGERLALFQKRAGHYYENWNTFLGEWEQRMGALIKEMNAITIPELPEYEDDAVIFEKRGTAQNHYVRVAFHRTMELYSQMWHHHFEMLMLGYGAYVVFFQFCKQAGIDVLMFRPDDQLKMLAKLAVELDLDKYFTIDGNPAVILPALKQAGAKGQRWLDALEEARDPWFNISIGDGFYHYERSWNDDLAVPLSALPHYIELVRKGDKLERPTEVLKQERQRIIDEYRSLLGSDDERAAFDQMLGVSHLVFPYVEDHKFYCEHWLTTCFFNKIREFGALLAESGFFAKEDDVFHLTHYELEAAIIDLMNAWSTGAVPRGPQHWPAIVAERKAAIAEWSKHRTPEALGPIPDVIDDPAIVMLWGITRETLDSWLNKGEENPNEVRGFAASSGVVEGTARVVKSVAEIGKLQPGDVLVCQVTNPTWAPVFQKIAAAVSDIGGSMSHAAIVAREYGLPAVVGTGHATSRIPDGARVRVDGARGIVTILEGA